MIPAFIIDQIERERERREYEDRRIPLYLPIPRHDERPKPNGEVNFEIKF